MIELMELNSTSELEGSEVQNIMKALKDYNQESINNVDWTFCNRSKAAATFSSVHIHSNEVMKPDVMKPEFGLLEVTKRLCVALDAIQFIY